MGGWLAGWVVFAETKDQQGLINILGVSKYLKRGKLLKGYYKNVPYPKWVNKVLIENCNLSGR